MLQRTETSTPSLRPSDEVFLAVPRSKGPGAPCLALGECGWKGAGTGRASGGRPVGSTEIEPWKKMQAAMRERRPQCPTGSSELQA